MRVLAIDPGYGRCGVAVLEKEKGDMHVVYSSCIETSAGQSFPERLARVADECTKLLKHYKPSCVAIERLYFSSNQKTAMHVAEVRGALIYVAALARIPVFEYTPAQVKSAITGWGKTDKRGIADMLKKLLKIQKDILHDDEYDAIAIGLTHLAHEKNNSPNPKMR